MTCELIAVRLINGSLEIYPHRSIDTSMTPSHRADKPIQHPLLPRLVEIDRQLVPLDRRHIPIAELLVEHPVADVELRRFGGHRLRHQLALDGAALDAAAAGAVAGVGFAVADALDAVAGAGAPVAVGGLGAVGLGAGPAGGGVGGGEGAGAAGIAARRAAALAAAQAVEAGGAVGVLAAAAPA